MDDWKEVTKPPIHFVRMTIPKMKKDGMTNEEIMTRLMDEGYERKEIQALLGS